MASVLNSGDFVTSHPTIAAACFTLLILGGNVGFPILLVFAGFLQTSSRNLVYYNFCLAWVFFSLSFCLLLYIGQLTGPQPEFGACLLQAVSVCVAPLLVSLTGCALVIQLWLGLRISNEDGASTISRRTRILLLAVPHALAISAFIALLVWGAMKPKQIVRLPSLFFCLPINKHVLTVFIAGFSLPQLVVFVFQGLIGRMMFNNWSRFRNADISGIPAIAFMIRLSVMSITGLLFIAITIVLTVTFSPTGGELAELLIVLSCTPVLAFLAFGTRLDLYRRSGPRIPVKGEELSDAEGRPSSSSELVKPPIHWQDQEPLPPVSTLHQNYRVPPPQHLSLSGYIASPIRSLSSTPASPASVTTQLAAAVANGENDTRV